MKYSQQMYNYKRKISFYLSRASSERRYGEHCGKDGMFEIEDVEKLEMIKEDGIILIREQENK